MCCEIDTTRTFGQRAIAFYRDLSEPSTIVDHRELINPFKYADVMSSVERFFIKFYTDSAHRICVIGINPGRFGSGCTGVPFTDGFALREYCGIETCLPQRRELTSTFIYLVIAAMGGVRTFFEDVYLTSAFPYGLARGGKNSNYYDDNSRLLALRPEIAGYMDRQLSFGIRRNAAIVIGSGKNFEFIRRINEEYGFFEKIYAVEHPRYIMQYKRSLVPDYVEKYRAIISSVRD